MMNDEAMGWTEVESATPPLPPVPTTVPAQTSVKGRDVCIAGALITAASTGLARLAGLPTAVLMTLIITGGVCSIAYLLSVMKIKDSREQRAAAKDIALIQASKGT